jgi:ER membrane protein complex subunit 2
VYGYYENIFIAALDHGDLDTADKYLQILVNRFPQSSRVKRLLGMAEEAQGQNIVEFLFLTHGPGDYVGALKIYDEILVETPTNLPVLKRKVSVSISSSSDPLLRQVAVHRAQGNMKSAVEALHEIVKLYQSDSSSWLELAEIHLMLCDYQVRYSAFPGPSLDFSPRRIVWKRSSF